MHNPILERSLMMAACALLLVAACAVSASAQLGGLGGLGDKLKKKTPNLLGGKQPITTSLPDAKWGDASKDGFTPREAVRSLMTLQRTPNGGFVLQPGYYMMQTQSYCLKAGTHGPGEGDGYIYAPPKGPAEDAVMTIVRNSVNHPEIEQQKIQQLLWAIIARAKFEDLARRLKATASRLLTPRSSPRSTAARSTCSRERAGERARRRPEPLGRSAGRSQLRQMLTTPGAVRGDGARGGALGRGPAWPGQPRRAFGAVVAAPGWLLGALSAYGYSSTRVEMWVPQGSPSVGKEFDPAAHIAVPGNTARQRLIQSGRGQQGR